MGLAFCGLQSVKVNMFPERVTGVDVTKRLFKVAAERQIPVYCLGQHLVLLNEQLIIYLPGWSVKYSRDS